VSGLNGSVPAVFDGVRTPFHPCLDWCRSCCC
jgi:hypothetical protein